MIKIRPDEITVIMMIERNVDGDRKVRSTVRQLSALLWRVCLRLGVYSLSSSSSTVADSQVLISAGPSSDRSIEIRMLNKLCFLLDLEIFNPLSFDDVRIGRVAYGFGPEVPGLRRLPPPPLQDTHQSRLTGDMGHGRSTVERVPGVR